MRADRGGLQGAWREARRGRAPLSAQPSRHRQRDPRRPEGRARCKRNAEMLGAKIPAALWRDLKAAGPDARRRADAALNQKEPDMLKNLDPLLTPRSAAGAARDGPWRRDRHRRRQLSRRIRRGRRSCGSTASTRRARSTPCSASCRSTISCPRRAGACRSSARPRRSSRSSTSSATIIAAREGAEVQARVAGALRVLRSARRMLRRRRDRRAAALWQHHSEEGRSCGLGDRVRSLTRPRIGEMFAARSNRSRRIRSGIATHREGRDGSSFSIEIHGRAAAAGGLEA